MTIEFRFQAGDVVEAQDNQRMWRLARIEKQAGYRGREGYYIFWQLAPDAPSWVSRGGWTQGCSVRSLADGEQAHAAAVKAVDRSREDRLRQEGVIGGRYDDNEPVAPLWLYRWVDGTSLNVGAVTHAGKTLYGPVPVTSK